MFGGVYQGVFLGGSAAQLGIRGVFREVVCTEFGLRTYSPVGLCLHHRGMNAQTGGSAKPKSVPDLRTSKLSTI